MRAAVFFDRDDTLIATTRATRGGARVGDLADPSLVELLPGVADACRDIVVAGYAVVIVSNQGAVARGNATLADVGRVNERARELLRTQAGVAVNAVYCCPFHPKGTLEKWTREHPWRKPAPGMVLAAAGELSIDVRRSWLVGDAERDLECGRRSGVEPQRLIRVAVADKNEAPAGELVDITEAARRICRERAPACDEGPAPILPGTRWPPESELVS